MRNLTLSLIALVASIGLIACGPSGKQVGLAKQARYQGDKVVLFGAVKTAVEGKHKILKSDEVALGLQTVARWYTRDGMVSRGTDENFQDVPAEAIRVTLVVRMVPDADAFLVQVEPSLMRKIDGSPQPQPLRATDPSVPGWVTGQVDELQFDIYDALKAYEVKAPGGLAPAAAPAEPAAPAAPEEPAAPAAPAAP